MPAHWNAPTASFGVLNCAIYSGVRIRIPVGITVLSRWRRCRAVRTAEADPGAPDFVEQEREHNSRDDTGEYPWRSVCGFGFYRYAGPTDLGSRSEVTCCIDRRFMNRAFSP
jgi:hypothetical protein